ncbi:MAG: hypothetical protein K6T31_04880 [Alicyclobacillus sp.]|nr:hypothetical protein [Alicyclobacillus sp.]
MYQKRTLLYTVFALAVALVIVALLCRSYTLLGVLPLVALVLAVIGEKWESAPTEPFKSVNQIHHRRPRAAEESQDV